MEHRQRGIKEEFRKVCGKIKDEVEYTIEPRVSNTRLY